MSITEDLLVDGLTTVVERTHDQSLAGDAGRLWATTAPVIGQVLPPEPCRLAFPAMIFRPDVRDEALVLVFDSRIVIAWRKGLLRKRVEHTSIDRARVSKVSWFRGNKPSIQGATLLELVADETTTVALPAGLATHAEWLRGQLS